MTESDWLATDSPARLFQFVKARLSARKLQLLACGCCRLVEQLLTPTERTALAVVERHADGLATDAEYQQVKEQFLSSSKAVLVPTPTGGVLLPTVEAAVANVWVGLVCVPNDDGLRRVMDWVATAVARNAATGLRTAARQDAGRQMCGVFREVVGNPFRERRAAGPEWTAAGGRAAPWMLRVSETARGIALGVQAKQAFDRLPILADALEDDGCADAELLAHLRGNSLHLRGCWAVDLVLGKS